jgi:hypothetical protein
MSPDVQAAYDRAIAEINAIEPVVPLTPFLGYLRTLARRPSRRVIEEALQMYLRRYVGPSQ